MQKRMLVFLQSTEPLLASQFVLDEKNNIVHTQLNTPLTECPSDTDAVVFLPAHDILLTHTTLPKLSQQRLMQALPFSLEEQLLDDVENLHFAIGARQADNQIPVAVITKQKMNAVLSALHEANISPTCVTSFVFALPTDEKIWYVYSDDTTSTIRTGKYTGFACEKNNLKMLLDLNLNEEKEKESIQISHINLENVVQHPTTTSINLLQGTYRTQRQTTFKKNIWLIAGILTAAWIGIAFFSNLVSFFILYSQSSHIETSINQIYKRQFPQATSMTSPRQRMEEKLKTVFAEANKNNFLALLSLIARSMSTNNSIYLQSLEFRDRQLTLEVSTNSFDNLDIFTTALTQQGLKVKRQNATTSGAQIKANLLINAGDS